MRLNERGRGRTRLSELWSAATGRDGQPCAKPDFVTVYRQYFEFVWSIARRMSVEPELMEGLVHDFFIVIQDKLETLQRPEALRSWIYGIVRRTASGHRRARRVREQLGVAIAVGEVPSREPTPLEQTEKQAELDMLARLLDELDENKREVFELVELQELTVPEVAELLDIPLNTAYSRLRAGRQAFEVALARHEARSRGR